MNNLLTRINRVLNERSGPDIQKYMKDFESDVAKLEEQFNTFDALGAKLGFGSTKSLKHKKKLVIMVRRLSSRLWDLERALQGKENDWLDDMNQKLSDMSEIIHNTQSPEEIVGDQAKELMDIGMQKATKA
jgi:hypothetical protein